MFDIDAGRIAYGNPPTGGRSIIEHSRFDHRERGLASDTDTATDVTARIVDERASFNGRR